MEYVWFTHTLHLLFLSIAIIYGVT